MIRVFFLGLIGLAALVVIARQFPAVPDGGIAPSEALDQTGGPFARMDGDWEGAVVTYLPDGTPLSTQKSRRQHDSMSPGLQNITITMRQPDGTTATPKVIMTGRSLEQQGALRRELSGPDGTLAVYAGRRAGLAMIWHRRDDAAGLEETLREEVIRTAQGDLYTLDGTGSYEKGRRRVIFEGRFRRPDSESDRP